MTTPGDGHVYDCCGKVGRISRHESWFPTDTEPLELTEAEMDWRSIGGRVSKYDGPDLSEVLAERLRGEG